MMSQSWVKTPIDGHRGRIIIRCDDFTTARATHTRAEILMTHGHIFIIIMYGYRLVIGDPTERARRP